MKTAAYRFLGICVLALAISFLWPFRKQVNVAVLEESEALHVVKRDRSLFNCYTISRPMPAVYELASPDYQLRIEHTDSWSSGVLLLVAYDPEGRPLDLRGIHVHPIETTPDEIKRSSGNTAKPAPTHYLQAYDRGFVDVRVVRKDETILGRERLEFSTQELDCLYQVVP